MSPARLAALVALSFLCLSGASLRGEPTPLPAPTSAKSLFQDRPFGPLPPPTPTPSPRRITVEEDAPIPASWWIGGLAFVVLALAGIFFAAARAWRSSNLFDRQYRFPVTRGAALRFGGTRSGGHMATIQFQGAPPPSSKAEDT